MEFRWVVLSKELRTVPRTHSELYVSLVAVMLPLLLLSQAPTLALGLEMQTQQGKSPPSMGFYSSEAEEGGWGTGAPPQGGTSHSHGFLSAWRQDWTSDLQPGPTRTGRDCCKQHAVLLRPLFEKSLIEQKISNRALTHNVSLPAMSSAFPLRCSWVLIQSN